MANEKNASVMWIALAVLVAAIGAAVAYKFRTMQAETVIAEARLDSSCDLHKGACSLAIPGSGRVSLEIFPRPVPVIEQLDLNVTTEGLDARAITVDFSGVDMNMGINRFYLKAKQDGRYHGNGILPVCVRNRMSWEAKVMVQIDGGTVVAPFRFDTVVDPKTRGARR